MADTNESKIEKVLSQVKKLLALAGNNPSEAEASAAALKAQELIAKYNLTVSEEETIDMSESAFVTGVDKSWKYGLADIIDRNFRCRHYWIGRRQVVFFGYKQDTLVAREVFEFLFKICERNARRECRISYQKYGTEKGVYFSYTRGFIEGVHQKLAAQCTALMIITPKEVHDKYEEHCKEMGAKKRTSSSNDGRKGFSHNHYNQGITDGRLAMNSRILEN